MGHRWVNLWVIGGSSAARRCARTRSRNRTVSTVPDYRNATTAAKLDLSALTVGGIAPSFVSIETAATLMSVSHWTIRRWITAGKLPARKMPSGCLRVAVADLEAVGEPVRPDKEPRPYGGRRG